MTNLEIWLLTSLILLFIITCIYAVNYYSLIYEINNTPDIIVWADTAEWEVVRSNSWDWYPNSITETSVYEIFQKADNEYYLKAAGYKPKEQEYYSEAVEKLNEFRNKNQ